MCTVVNVLNENTFASTSPLLQPRKSISRTTDYGQRYGKEFFDMFLRLRVATLITDYGLQTTDYGRGGSRNYGIMEIELRFATPRQRDFGFAGQQTTDNGRGGSRSHGITELQSHGSTELWKLRQDNESCGACQ